MNYIKWYGGERKSIHDISNELSWYIIVGEMPDSTLKDTINVLLLKISGKDIEMAKRDLIDCQNNKRFDNYSNIHIETVEPHECWWLEEDHEESDYE